MPVVAEHNFFFIHIAKTGGTSICDFFNLPRDGHQSLQAYLLKIGKEGFLKWDAMTVVRDPATRFLSAWNMSAHPDDETCFQTLREKYSPHFDKPVNDFVLSGILSELATDNDAPWFWHQGRQLLFEGGQKKKYIYIPRYVLIFEQLVQDFSLFAKAIGFDFNPSDFPHSMKSPIADNQEQLSPEAIEYLQAHYYDDYLLINGALSTKFIDPDCRTSNLAVRGTDRDCAGLFELPSRWPVER